MGTDPSEFKNFIYRDPDTIIVLIHGIRRRKPFPTPHDLKRSLEEMLTLDVALTRPTDKSSLPPPQAATVAFLDSPLRQLGNALSAPRNCWPSWRAAWSGAYPAATHAPAAPWHSHKEVAPTDKTSTPLFLPHCRVDTGAVRRTQDQPNQRGGLGAGLPVLTRIRQPRPDRLGVPGNWEGREKRRVVKRPDRTGQGFRPAPTRCPQRTEGRRRVFPPAGRVERPLGHRMLFRGRKKRSE